MKQIYNQRRHESEKCFQLRSHERIFFCFCDFLIFFFVCLKFLLVNGIVILALLATPVDWIKLEESESSTLAASGTNTGASSGLHDDWNVISGCTNNCGCGGGEFLFLVRSEGSLLWIGVRGDWSEDQEVWWSSLSESGLNAGGWLLSEGEEGRVSADHGCMVGHGRVSSVDWLGGSWGERLELHCVVFVCLLACFGISLWEDDVVMYFLIEQRRRWTTAAINICESYIFDKAFCFCEMDRK